MPNQILQIEPQNELKFKVDSSGRFEHGHTTYMRLSNPTNDTVLFKIKTTAPKKYCVRPNSGALEPNSKVEIAITPQPVLVDANEKHKHKFMVQSAVAPEGKTNIDQVWREIGTHQLMDYKLKCVFDAPRGTNLNDSGDNATQNEITKKSVLPDETKSVTKDVVEGLIQNEAKRKDDENTTASINSKTVTIHTIVCHSCWITALNESNRYDVQQPSTSSGQRRRLLCVMCRFSLLQIRFHTYNHNDTADIWNVINHLIRPRQNLFSSSENAESDLQKATSEVLLLREEESKLRHENLQLKEDLLRFRQAGGDRRDVCNHSYDPQKNVQTLPLPWVITAIGMAMLGILIGKFFI